MSIPPPLQTRTWKFSAQSTNQSLSPSSVSFRTCSRFSVLLTLFCLSASWVFGQTATTNVSSNVVTVTCVSPAVPASPVSNVNGVVTVVCQIPTPVVALPAVNITASSSTIAAGERVTLNYTAAGTSVTRAIYSTGTQSSSVQVPSGSITLTPETTAVYTISATNSAGSASKSVTVTVTPAAPVVTAPVITSFTATPASVVAGGNSALSWTVTGTSPAITLNGATATSPTTKTPSETTTYTLQASNSSGTVSKAVTVTVTPAPVSGVALSACQDITASGTYYLANDVSSAGTCFGIDANNITLNLNGHTITYGTGGGNSPTPAIEGHDSWWTGSPNYTGSTYVGTAHSGLEVYGGNIVQSMNSATFSDVFAFGQGTFSSAPYIHDITATFQNTGAQFYNSAYLPTGAKIENNTIYDNVTNIQQPGQGYLSARAQFNGEVIYISGQENNPVTSGDTISGNKIVGGPQGGILTFDQYSTIANNDVAQDANYSNDFCVEIDADHTTATGNNCHPKSGRGINVDASYVTVENNTIDVTELPQNMEYGTNGQPGCEGGGAYGVRVETMPLPNQPGAMTNDTVSGNTITVTANACYALGLDLIYIPANASGINITGNTITTTNAGQSGVLDSGFQLDDSFGNGISITGNTVTSTDYWMYGAWDGFSDITVGHNTWNGSPHLTFFSGDGGCDPTQQVNGVPNSPASCPVSINITDALPNKVTCGPYSVATIAVNGQVTVCKPTE